MQMRTVPLPHSGLLHNLGIELASPNLGAIVRPLLVELNGPINARLEFDGSWICSGLAAAWAS